MGTIKQHLSDIEKLVAKQSKTNKQMLEDVNNELKLQEEMHKLFGGNKTDKQITLEKAKKILEEEIEKEEEKEELTRIKLNKQVDRNIKEEIKNELFSNLNYYFKEYKTKHASIHDILLDNDTIDYEISRITKIYGSEYEDYLYSIYMNVFNKVYSLYKNQVNKDIKEIQDRIKLEQKISKEQQQAREQRNKQKIKRNYGFAVACYGLSKLVESTRSRRGRKTSR